MPIETEFRGVREVGAELDEQRAEVAVDEVDVVVIDHHRRADDPGIDATSVAPLLGAEDTGLLLGLADEQHALVAVELGEVLFRDVVLPLALLERDQVHPCGLGKGLHGVHESLAHRRHHHRRRHPDAELRLEEVDEPAARLQRRHIGIEIHPVDGVQLEGHVVLEDLRNVFAYHDGGAPGERGRHGHRPEQGPLPRRRVQALPAPGAPLCQVAAPIF